MGDLLDPKIDFVFKRIFGSEENKDVLLAFLNETFKAAKKPPLTEISLMNPYVDPNAVGDKQSILDIRAVTAEGEQINIEIQLLDQRDIQKRTLYYWAKLYEEQLDEGQLYKDLKKRSPLILSTLRRYRTTDITIFFICEKITPISS